jgi:2-dehydro-3-deoxyphosphogluconate aldolase/(4S)-4-hydroxy-2-oxoglutarate aldolase
MTPQDMTPTLRALCTACPVVPVIEIQNAADARPLAEALVSAGVAMLEVTLRTEAALDAIAQMAQVDGAVVGAGTLLTPEQVRQAKDAGAQFGVSPGATPKLLDAIEANDLPTLPGASSVSEVMALLERGYEIQKFFPAEASGGVSALKSISGPIPQVSFCPTGGITRAKMPDYLALNTVICAGASWLSPKDKLAAQAFDDIAEDARSAIADLKSL